MKRLLSLALVTTLFGCASTSPEEPFRDTGALVRARIARPVHWNQESDADAAAARSVHALLAKELTVDGAVQVALLNNRHLQATFEDLRIAQADLVQAGLLKNPTLSGGLEFPIAGHDVTTGGNVSVSEDFMSIVTIAARKRIAHAGLEAAEARVAGAVLETAFDAEKSFYELQSAMQIAALRRTLVESGDAAVSLAERQHEAGNINDLDLANEQGAYEQLRTDLIRSDQNVATAHEELARRLGVWGSDVAYKVGAKLPELPQAEVSLEHLESLAVARRLDLRAAHAEAQKLSEELAAAKNFRWLGSSSAGADYSRDPERYSTLGPSGSVELPIFDQRQAEIARLEGELRAALAREGALAVDVRSEVREARERLVATRALVERYAAVVIPLREKQLGLSQQQYDAMLLGSYQLLAAKQNEITGYREFIEALRDYWIASAELERASGGSLQRTSPSTSTKKNDGGNAR